MRAKYTCPASAVAEWKTATGGYCCGADADMATGILAAVAKQAAKNAVDSQLVMTFVGGAFSNLGLYNWLYTLAATNTTNVLVVALDGRTATCVITLRNPPGQVSAGSAAAADAADAGRPRACG